MSDIEKIRDYVAACIRERKGQMDSQPSYCFPPQDQMFFIIDAKRSEAQRILDYVNSILEKENV